MVLRLLFFFFLRCGDWRTLIQLFDVGGMIFATRFGGGASRGKKGLVCCGGGSVTVECGWSDENQCKRLTETSILQVVSECCS